MTTIEPPFLDLPDEKAYLEHFLTHYCRRVIKTHEGIRFFSKKTRFFTLFMKAT